MHVSETSKLPVQIALLSEAAIEDGKKYFLITGPRGKWVAAELMSSGVINIMSKPDAIADTAEEALDKFFNSRRAAKEEIEKAQAQIPHI